MPSPESGQSWGIFGGRFDPVHTGHIALAQAVLTTKRFSGILFIPSVKNPLKQQKSEATFDDRMAMLRLACDSEPRFLVSDIEQRENLPGYTLDTIQALKKVYPRVSFHFLIGADLLEGLRRWHRIDELIKLIPFIAVSRPEYTFTRLPNAYKDRIELLTADTPDVSSTEVRYLLKSHLIPERLNALLPASVIAYIQDRGLYRE